MTDIGTDNTGHHVRVNPANTPGEVQIVWGCETFRLTSDGVLRMIETLELLQPRDMWLEQRFVRGPVVCLKLINQEPSGQTKIETLLGASHTPSPAPQFTISWTNLKNAFREVLKEKA